MSRTTSAAIVLIASLAVAATAASAHPKLQSSNPAAGTTLKTPPKEIRMNFSEELVAAFSGIEVKNSGGKSVPTGKMTFAPGDMRKIIVPIPARLAPGTYRVAWHAVSTDTHRISGQYSFKVVR
jgi:methionine-rich copper-binding protein CopC